VNEGRWNFTTDKALNSQFQFMAQTKGEANKLT
jgi:hypothetical protein